MLMGFKGINVVSSGREITDAFFKERDFTKGVAKLTLNIIIGFSCAVAFVFRSKKFAV